MTPWFRALLVSGIELAVLCTALWLVLRVVRKFDASRAAYINPQRFQGETFTADYAKTPSGEAGREPRRFPASFHERPKGGRDVRE